MSDAKQETRRTLLAEKVSISRALRLSVPPEARLYHVRDTNQPVLLSKRVLASGDQMVNAKVGTDQNGLPAVDITLNSAAGQRMFDFTSNNVGKLMSVVYIERIPTVTIVDGQEVRSVKVREEALAPTRVAGPSGAPVTLMIPDIACSIAS